MASDRHLTYVEALRRAVFGAAGVVPPDQRRAAAERRQELPAALRDYLDKVAEAPTTVTDHDVAALVRAGHGEEELFELTVSAAVGAGLLRLDRGLAALEGSAACDSASSTTGTSSDAK